MNPHFVRKVALCALITLLTGFFTYCHAQAPFTGEFRSRQSGNWNDVNSWEQNTGIGWIFPAKATPRSASTVVTIRNSHTITVVSNLLADEVVVEAGGTLIIRNGAMLSVVNATGALAAVNDLDIRSGGVVINNGTLVIATSPLAQVQTAGILQNSGTISGASASSLSFLSGSQYDHMFTTSAGTIPLANWNANSTCLISGYTTNTAAPANLNQSFANFTWNTASSTAPINLNGALGTVNGNLTVSASPANLVFTESSPYILNVLGNFTVNGNSLVSFTGSANVTVNASGSFLYNSSNTGVSNASAGPGTVTMNIGESFNVMSGSFTAAPGVTSVAGNFLNNGTFNAGSSTIQFNGSGTQSIQGSAVTDFNNITVTNATGSPGVSVESNQNLRGVLTLGTGSVLDADGSNGMAVFTLVSSGDNPTSDASIAALPEGASVTGKVTVQRYMSREGPNARIYRYIASPVQEAPVSQIQAKIPVTGSFTGSSTCSGCATNQSMFSYNEKVVTGDLNAGYIDFPDRANTEKLQAGRGYAIFVRGNVDPVKSAGSARWDVRNPINSGTVNFPVTFTSSGNPANDGWNLIGNPYPSTIDWDALNGWTKSADIGSTIYMRDNGNNGQYATWNGAIGVNGGSRYIAMGQGFWIKSDGTGTPVLSANEQVKTAGQQTTFFREASPTNILRITLRQGNLRDESVIHFRKDATESYDHHADARKLQNETFNLSTLSAQGLKLAINSLPSLTCGTTVRMDVSDVKAGHYEIEFSALESFSNEVEVGVYDSYADTLIDATTVSSYAFDVSSDPASLGSNRFTVSFSYKRPLEIEAHASDICSGDAGSIVVKNSQLNVLYSLYHNGELLTGSVAGTGGDLHFAVAGPKLSSGDNEFYFLYSPSACSSMTFKKVINVRSVALTTISAEPAERCGSGRVVLTASGAEEGRYRWYETEDSDSAIAGADAATFTTGVLNKSKTYYVSAVNGLGCESERRAVAAVIHQYEEATIRVSDDGSTLTSSYETGNQWYFNGVPIEGATMNTVEAERPGLYEVQVHVGACVTNASWTKIITGLDGDEGVHISFFPNPVKDQLIIESPDMDAPVKGVVYNSDGQRMGTIEFRHDGDKMRAEHNFAGYPSGIYILGLTRGREIIRYKVVKE